MILRLKYFTKKYKEQLLIAILIIFYSVGTLGILTNEYKNEFLTLSPYNLILSFIILLLSRKKDFYRFFFFLAFTFLIGMIVEYIGTSTGLLFGDYFYGDNLGFKLKNVPFVIGLNWGILIVTTSSLINRIKISVYFKIIISALLMTLFDVLVEPVAIESDFWHWKNEEIPFFNYLCWFLISLPLQTIYFKFRLVESNKVFDALFIILVLFFSLLISF